MKADNAFKQKLYRHTIPVREENWTAIEKHLPASTEERKAPFFWLILFSSTLLAGAMMFGFLQPKDSPVTPQISQDNYQVPDATFHATPMPTSAMAEQASPSNTGAQSPNAIAYGDTQNSESTAGNSITLLAGAVKPKNSNASGTVAASAASESGMSLPSQTQTPVAEAVRQGYITDHLPGLAHRWAETAETSSILIPALAPDPNCYKFSKSGGQYYFSADFFAGPGFSPRTFADNGSSSVYREARSTTERNQYALSIGARFNLHLHNGFALRLGLLYDQTGDVFDYTDTLATQSTTRIDSFFSADGTFLYADTNRILIFGTLIKQIYNTYRHLDVPILASYEIPVGRSTIMFNAGPVFNLTTSTEGQILDAQLHPRQIKPGFENGLSAYRTSLGLSAYLGIGAVIPVTSHLAALIEPRFLLRIKPVTIRSYPLEEHRHFAGLNMGIRYFLN